MRLGDTVRISLHFVQQRTELPFWVTAYPLGFPLVAETNDRGVIEAIQESWGKCAKAFESPPVRLRIGVEPSPGEPLPPLPTVRARDHLLTIIADRRNVALCDYMRSFAFACVTSSVAADHAWFRRHFLEPMAHSLLDQLSLATIPAACVARNGRGVLLCGPPRAGGSGLARACTQRGWTAVSAGPSMLLRTGGVRRVIGTAPPAACRVEAILFLNRAEECEASLIPIEPAAALDMLAREMPLYDRQVSEEQLWSLEQLVEAPAYELCFGDPAAAADEIESLMSRLCLEHAVAGR